MTVPWRRSSGDATEVSSEQRKDRIAISSHPKVVDHKDRMDLDRQKALQLTVGESIRQSVGYAIGVYSQKRLEWQILTNTLEH